MSLVFRNVDADPSAPVRSWPYEALVIAIERGTVADWARITAEIRRDPWGPVARQVEEHLGYAPRSGVGALLSRAIDSAREEAERSERAEVAVTVDGFVRESGLTTAEFARRVGTSRSRLSTYRSGRVTPSAALLVRMRRVSREAAEGA